MKKLLSRGQTFIEYSLLLGVLVAILIAVTPMIKRGTQAMIKVVADQIGNQVNADQLGGEYGHLVDSNSAVGYDLREREDERLGIINYVTVQEITDIRTVSIMNQGFSERSDD